MAYNRLLITDNLSARQLTAAVIGLFITIGFLIYGYSVITNQFVEFDDTLLIIDNLSVIQAGRLSSVLWAFGHYDPELYIPLTFVSFQLDAVIGGLNPWIFHLDNLFQHIINSLLITWILKLLFKRTDAAVILGLLFLVHPLNTEAVAWASGRKDLLSTLYFLASIGMYLRFRQYEKIKLYWASLGLFVLALFAKISVAPLPIALLAFDWLLDQSISLRNIWRKKGFFIAALFLGLIALLGKDQVLARSSTESVLLLIPRTILFYIEKLILPINLSILYPYPQESVTLMNPAIAFSVLVFIAAIVAMWIYRKRQRVVVCGAVIAFVLLSPSFLQYYRGAELYLATDRYMYMPFLGVLMILAPLLIYLLKRWERVTYGVCAAVIAIFAIASFQRSKVWENTYTLFANSLETAETFGAYEKVGVWFLREGHRKEAIAALKRSIELGPTSAAYFRLGVAAMEAGNREDAKLFTEEALRLSPENNQALTNMSMFYWDEGNVAEAIRHAELSIQYHPFSEMGLGNLATIYTLTGQKEKALVVIETMLDVYPNHERVPPLLKILHGE
ncbi:MAG: tetratricopeptide repeat protein [Candidatus Peribacteraceae bacterium]|jgi:tetratricopeptide (TPR) repeat protein|nr:hypothetical protein [bacterium]MDP6561461.1 tetratricopeptide repeat protein [Candidatus Peribacteraceae bacterium]|tara:strand:- start:9112 stop:10794 length:1683 start_codon:yes stop_codon:yes gene_type:complete